MYRLVKKNIEKEIEIQVEKYKANIESYKFDIEASVEKYGILIKNYDALIKNYDDLIKKYGNIFKGFSGPNQYMSFILKEYPKIINMLKEKSWQYLGKHDYVLYIDMIDLNKSKNNR